MLRNEVKAKLDAGKVVFGSYVPIPSRQVVEILAVAGLDFMRLDPYHHPFNRESIEDCVNTAYGYNITPGARIRNDWWEIATTLDAGVQIITLPNVGTVEQARSAASAARYPPHGIREVGRPLRFRNINQTEYREYAEREIMVSCQIEGLDGIENYREIVKVDGVHIIQTGRNDIANAMGIADGAFDPKVLEIEERIVAAAVAAGKHVSLNVPLNETGIEHVRKMAKQGVRMFTIGNPIDVMVNAYRNGLTKLNDALSLVSA